MDNNIYNNNMHNNILTNNITDNKMRHDIRFDEIYLILDEIGVYLGHVLKNNNDDIDGSNVEEYITNINRNKEKIKKLCLNIDSEDELVVEIFTHLNNIDKVFLKCNC